MKKLLTFLITFAMVLTTVSGFATADDCDCCGEYDCDCPEYECPPEEPHDEVCVDTQVTIANINVGGNPGSGGTGSTSWDLPVIKCKWEVTDDDTQEDDDMVCYDTQVAPKVGGQKWIHYYAIILAGSADIHNPNVGSVYAYVFHPDCSYKYKVPMTVLDKNEGQRVWDQVASNNPTVVKFGEMEPGIDYDFDEVSAEIYEYLNAKVYYGKAQIDYCQPGGCYKVGVRAFDGVAWSEQLWNNFWYIPTAAIAIDFDTVDYGSAVTVGANRWTEGNKVWDDGIYTIRNYGNVPVDLSVVQDDMGFSTDSSGAWNVEFDARLGAEGRTYVYDPYEEQFFGTLPLCTQEKIDFSIHIKEAYPGEIYFGEMCIMADMNGDPDDPYVTPEENSITGDDLKQDPPQGIDWPPCCDNSNGA